MPLHGMEMADAHAVLGEGPSPAKTQQLPLSVLFAPCWKDANCDESDDDLDEGAGEDLVLECAGGRQVAASSLLLRVAAGPALRARIRQATAGQHAAAGGSQQQRSGAAPGGSNGTLHAVAANGTGLHSQQRVSVPGCIDVRDDDAADWVLLLHHLYSGAMELTRQPPPISWGNVERLLRLSAKHDIKPTLRRCQAFLHKAICPLQPPAGGADGFPAAVAGAAANSGGGGVNGAALAAAASAWPAGATAVKWLSVFEELSMPELYEQQMDCLLAGLQHINADKRASATLLAFLQAQAGKHGGGLGEGFSGATASMVLVRVLGAFIGSVNAQVAAEDSSGLKEKDVTAVMRQARVVRSEAVAALRAANGSVTAATAALQAQMAARQRSISISSEAAQPTAPQGTAGNVVARRATVSFDQSAGSERSKGRMSPHRPVLRLPEKDAAKPAAAPAGSKMPSRSWSKMLKKF